MKERLKPMTSKQYSMSITLGNPCCGWPLFPSSIHKHIIVCFEMFWNTCWEHQPLGAERNGTKISRKWTNMSRFWYLIVFQYPNSQTCRLQFLHSIFCQMDGHNFYRPRWSISLATQILPGATLHRKHSSLGTWSANPSDMDIMYICGLIHLLMIMV